MNYYMILPGKNMQCHSVTKPTDHREETTLYYSYSTLQTHTPVTYQ